MLVICDYKTLIKYLFQEIAKGHIKSYQQVWQP